MYRTRRGDVRRHTWNFRSLELSLPGSLLPGTFVPTNEYSKERQFQQMCRPTCTELWLSRHRKISKKCMNRIIKPPLAIARAASCNASVHLFVCSSVRLSVVSVAKIQNAIFAIFYFFLFFKCSLAFDERRLSYRLRYTCL